MNIKIPNVRYNKICILSHKVGTFHIVFTDQWFGKYGDILTVLKSFLLPYQMLSWSGFEMLTLLSTIDISETWNSIYRFMWIVIDKSTK